MKTCARPHHTAIPNEIASRPGPPPSFAPRADISHILSLSVRGARMTAWPLVRRSDNDGHPILQLRRHKPRGTFADREVPAPDSHRSDDVLAITEAHGSLTTPAALPGAAAPDALAA